MKTKVCANCLELLTTDRREKGHRTCIRCEQTLKVAQQEKLSSATETPLQAALKRDLEETLKKEAEKKHLAQQQQNRSDFFDIFKKIKK
jgi:methylphosphotriester-DNA--protein-cysteine methyltransferase